MKQEKKGKIKNKRCAPNVLLDIIVPLALIIYEYSDSPGNGITADILQGSLIGILQMNNFFRYSRIECAFLRFKFRVKNVAHNYSLVFSTVQFVLLVLCTYILSFSSTISFAECVVWGVLFPQLFTIFWTILFFTGSNPHIDMP